MPPPETGEDWPFEDPRNVATISLRRIVFSGRPVLYVEHDDEDGTWVMLDDEPMTEKDACVVALEEMVVRDPTLIELADLPCGWEARRDFVGGPWRRAKCAM
ncbi:MAG: hypothetical protein KF691_01815 [Phycisphaeraceae bacterium]|nr:hypothetical protein [Phycisphaeraceae bacterium]